MPVNRMRMRPWLVKMIESNTISGLEWIDKDMTTFTIPWKHAARHGWDLEKDACLFQKWAVHTGKYTEGQAKDPKTWKANFRCALNSLPDIEEVKDRSVNKGHHAKRVFKMLPQASKSRDKRTKGKATKTHRRKSPSSHFPSSPCSSSSKTDGDVDGSESRSSADESALEEEVATQENTVGSSTPDSSCSWSTCSSSSSSSSSSSPLSEDPFPLAPPSFSEYNWPIPENLFHRFQVSPDHQTEYDTTDDIIQICQELERIESEDYRSSWTNSSPVGGELSDSSVEDSDDTPLYTTLGSDSMFPADWNPFRNFT